MVQKKRSLKDKSEKELSEIKDKDVKAEAVKLATAALKKKYGKAAIIYMKDFSKRSMDLIPTGSVGLDFAIGLPGIPRGKMVEVIGEEASGKTTLAISIIAQALSKFPEDVLFIDAEKSLDPELMVEMGVDISRVVMVDMDTAEENLTATETLVKTGAFSAVIVDSVAALVPTAEFDGDMDDQFMGLHARLMGKMCRSLKPACSKTNTLLLLINQVRHKIGAYGNPDTTPGGKAIPFFSDLRIKVSGGATKKQRILGTSGEAIGHVNKFVVIKNKLKRPWREAEVDLLYGSGYDVVGELLSLGIATGLVSKEGSWFSYEGIKAQGIERFKLALSADKGIEASLKKDVSSVLWQTK